MSDADAVRLVAGDSAGTASAHSAVEAIVEPTLEPLFWDALRLGVNSAWWLHVPFARWLVAAMRPAAFVELGTHSGVSYSAFCQAVKACGLATRCHAVDTWRGDAHAGTYDEAVFAEFSDFHQQHFGAFSTLVRATFDEARAGFADGTIDLLHIDGFHSYDVVRHDFENWLPALSERGVVLFHDVNEKREDFGVWKLWDELLERFPGFTFLHGHGLGVLAAGAQVPSDVLDLCQLRDPVSVAAVRDRFAALGDRCLQATWRLMAEQRAATAEQAAHNACTERDRLNADCNALRSLLHDSESQRVAEAAAAATAKAAAAAELERVTRELDCQLDQLRRQAAELSDQVVQLHSGMETTGARASAAEAALHSVLDSTLWQATWPLRRAGRYFPAELRRYVRGGMRLIWWSATLQIGSKLRNRNPPDRRT